MNKTSAKLAIARNIRFFRIENRFSGRELAKRIDYGFAPFPERYPFIKETRH